MNARKILGIILVIGGVVLYFLANYIAEQVEEGKGKISKAQRQVNQTRGLTSLSPYTKDVGNMIADSAQQKIDAGQEEVDEYEKLSNQLHVGGIALVIAGIGLFAIGFIHRKHHH